MNLRLASGRLSRKQGNQVQMFPVAFGVNAGLEKCCMPEVVKVAEVGEIPEGEGKAVSHGKHRIAVFNVGGEFHAISDACPHAGGPLSDGWVEGTEVTCPWHGWAFDIKYSEDDRRDGICRYKVRVEGNDISVEIPD